MTLQIQEGNKGRKDKMELKEYRLLDLKASVLKHQALDTLSFIEVASNKDLLDRMTACKLKQKLSGIDDTELERINEFIFEMAKCITFEGFLDILGSEWFAGFDGVVSNLKMLRYGHMGQICPVKREVADSSMLVKFCCDMKQKVDNKFHDNLPYYFKDLTKRVHSLVLENGNDRQRHSLANQLGVLIWLQTQLHRNVETRKHILTDFRDKFTNSVISETSFIDTVFHCKMACTAVLNGDFDLAFAFITQAEIYANECKWRFARTLVHHDRQFVFRKRNVDNKDPSNVKEIIENCEKGLTTLEDFDVENQVILKRIFLLNKVQALLGIGTYLEITTGESVRDEDKQRANELLSIVERLSESHPMEKRRKMLFLVCKGRIHELNNSENVALDCLRESKELSKAGGILSNLESQNIEEYSKSLGD